MKPLVAFSLGVVVTLSAMFTYTKIPRPVPATLSGSVSYPSAAIPNGLTICAENITTNDTACTGPFISSSQGGIGFIPGNQFTYGVGYELSVPAGTYRVYATSPSLDTPAYYSYYVACLASLEREQRGQTCDDHTPINVTVVPGQTIADINPGDWDAR